MTDHAPLTDEELAAIESSSKAYYGTEGTVTYDPDIARLIADLRACQAREKDLGMHNGHLRVENERLCKEVKRLNTNLRATRAEVERLREALMPFVKAGMVEDVTNG